MKLHNVLIRPTDLFEEILRRKLISGGGGAVLQTVTGVSPLTLLNVASKGIKSLTQFGKCEQTGTPTPSVPVDIKCNNGTLKMVDDELPTGYKRVLGFKMNNNSYWEIADFPLYGSDTLRFSFDATDACNIIGAYSGSASGNNYSLYVSTNSNYLRYKSGAYNSAIDYDKRYDVELTSTGSSGMKVDSTWTAQTFTTPTNLCIGTTAKSASSAKLKGNLYGNIEVVDRAKFVPCERVSDNALGYYDTIGEAFYEQASGFSGAVSLGYDGSHYSLAVNGTPEVLTVVDGRRTLSAVLGGTIESRGGTNGTENNKRARIEYQYLKAGTYTLSTSGVCDQAILCSYSSEQGADFEPIGSWSWVALPRTFTLESGRYVRAMVRKSTDEVLTSANIGDFQIDAFSGYPEHQTQTATAENLLGVTDFKDEQEIISGVVTRACGIKVLDGTEEWTTDTYGGYRRMVLQEVLNASGDTLSVVCSHYVSRSADARQQPNSIFIASSGKLVIYVDSTQNITTADEFNAWLAAQYANGTPVVVVYPLAEATTEQVTGQHLTAKDTATITAQSEYISGIELEVEYWQKTE